jgi:geranylgeranyl pyrophosphate synthase
VSAETVREAIRLLAESAGDEGMIGGQTIDLDGETRRLEFSELLRLHRLKTGALIKCAALLGVLAAGYGRDSREAEDAERYADGIGLAFQVVDDILDATATAEELGKSVGGDAERNKTTFLSYYSVEGAWEYAREITEGAVRSIDSWSRPDTLCDLAYYLLNRKK